MKISRDIFISGPYKKCPSCKTKDSFGVFMTIAGNDSYQRECRDCRHTENYKLPLIKKRIVYLDQFILSNLLKLLDSDHPSHEKVKKDSFWRDLYIKLEHVSRAQAVIFPDSFYHKEESIAGDNVDFNLMRRLYEYFSSGKTLHPSFVIEKNQITEAFKFWLNKQDPVFEYNPETISFEGSKLHDWTVGMGINVGGPPKDEEVLDLKKRNQSTKEWIEKVWNEWRQVKPFNFVLAVQNEARAIKYHLINTYKWHKKQQELMVRAQNGEVINWELEDIFPPTSKDIFDSMYRICKTNNISDDNAVITIVNFFNDAEYLLKIPKIRISSVMYANLARGASLGEKKSPNSFTDIGFISSYMPYCDAVFVDTKSKILIDELPKDTPDSFRIDNFTSKIFSPQNKTDFLIYLDSIIADIPNEQIELLKDINGDDYMKPYWRIIEDEKKKPF